MKIKNFHYECITLIKKIFLFSITGPSEENNIDSIIDTNKIVDSPANVCDINGQVSTTISQSTQLSLSTISAPSVETQQVSANKINDLLLMKNY